MRSVSAYQALFCAAEAAGLRAQQAGLHLVGRCISSSASSWATGVRDEEPAHRASASSGSVGQGADAQPTTSAPARTRRRGVLKRDLKLRVDDQGGPSLLERFGAALTSDHQALAGSDASVLSQRLQDQTGQWQAQGTMAEFIPFLRRHNHSLPNLPGQVRTRAGLTAHTASLQPIPATASSPAQDTRIAQRPWYHTQGQKGHAGLAGS